MNISEQAMIEMIDMNVKGNTMVSLDSVTTPKMRKTNNPYLGVKKYQSKSGCIGFDYRNSVNNQAEREDKEYREVKKRAWGVLSPNRIWVHHTDKKGNFKVYLQLKLQSTANTVYRMPDGSIVDEEKLLPFMQESEPSSTQADLDKNIIVNDINIENIVAIRMFGKEWKIVNEVSQEVVEVAQNEMVEA
jgi:hypothetical protein